MGVIQNILNSRFSKNGDFFVELQKTLGFAPKNMTYYRRAFTHRSSQKTDKFGNELNFERLEFLGDAVLGAVIAAYLFRELPDSDEGNLTQMRSKIVSRKFLNELGKELRLMRFIEEEVGREHLGDNINGNLVEALIGAIYMDRGFNSCRKFIYSRVIDNFVDIDRLEGAIMSYKSYLIEWCQKEKKAFQFQSGEETEEEATVKHFVARMIISGKVVGKARSTSKKKAEEKAAKRAYFALQHRLEP